MLIGAMNHPGRDPVEEIRWIGQHGFDFVDLTLEPPGADPADCEPSAIRAALDQYQLDVVAHTAYYLPMGSPFASVRTAVLREFERALRAAAAVGARVMNTHFSKSPSLFSRAQMVAWHVDVLQPLCRQAADLGVTIVIEHVPGVPGQIDMIQRLLEAIPELRFHLDSGHAKLESSEDLWDQYLARFGAKLVHVHLSENDGTSDQHLPLAAAPFSATDWPTHIAKLKHAGYDSTITLEVFAPDRRYLLQSRDLLRTWWDLA